MQKRRQNTSLLMLLFVTLTVAIPAIAQERTYDEYLNLLRNAQETADFKTSDKLADLALTAARTPAERSNILHAKGTILYRMSNFEQARECFLKALKEAEEGRVSLWRFGEIYEELGRTYQKLRDYKNAEQSYTKAIDCISRDTTNKDQDEKSAELGHIYLVKTQVTASEADAQEAIRLLKYGKSQSDKEGLISANVQLADLLMKKGEKGKAEEIYRKSIEDRTKLIGTVNHKNNAYALYILGTWCEEQGRLAEAEECYKRALTIAESVRGPVHIQVATVSGRLAEFYGAQARYADAERHALQALSITQKLSSSESPDAAKLQLHLDSYRSCQGKKARSDEAIAHSVGIVEKHYGPNSEQTANAYMQLATCFEDRDLPRARQYVAKALKIAKSSKYTSELPMYTKSARLAIEAEDYAAAKTFLDGLIVAAGLSQMPREQAEETYSDLFAAYYKGINQLDKAERLYKNQRLSQQQKWGEGHPQVALAMNDLAMLYLKRGLYQAALSWAEKALSIDKATFGISNPDTLKKMTTVAQIYAAAGDYKSAEPIAKLALEEQKKILQKEHSDLQYTRKVLDSLYDTNKHLRASKPLLRIEPAVKQTAPPKPDRGDAGFQTAAATKPKVDLYSPQLPDFVKVTVNKGLQNNRIDSIVQFIGTYFMVLESKLGKTDTVIADHLQELAAMLESGGFHAQAKKYLDRAYSIWMALQPRMCVNGDNVDYQISQMATREGGLNAMRLKAAQVLIQAAHTRSEEGDSQTCAMCVNGAQKCLEAADVPADKSRRVKLLLDLAKLTRQRTDFAHSRTAADFALKVADQGSTSPVLKRDSLLELARLTLAQRDYASSTRFATQCLESAEADSSGAPRSKSQKWETESLSILCTCSAELGKTEAAIQYGTKATAALEAESKSFNESMIELVETLAEVLTKKKEYAQSVLFIDKGLEHCRTFNRTNTMTYADLLWSKARLKRVLRAEEESKTLLDQAVTIYKAIVTSADTVAAIHCHNQIAVWEHEHKNYKTSGDAALKAAQKVAEYVRNVFPQLSFGEQCAFLQNTIRPQVGYLLEYNDWDSKQLGASYDLLLQWKGLLISSLRKQTVVISSEANKPEVANLIASLDDVRKQLAAWHLKMSDRSLTPAQWTQKNDELTVRKESIERELSKQTKQSGYFDHASSVDSHEFGKMLAKDEIFLDFFRYTKPGLDIQESASAENSSSARYAVYILSHEFIPWSIFLGSADELEKAIKDWRSDVLDCVPDTESRAKLSELVWKKISDVVFSDGRKKVAQYVEPKRIFISPDAEIARVPWSVFFDKNSKEEALLTSVFDSPREFINVRLDRLLSNDDISRMMLVGNVDFHGTDIESLAATEKEVAEISEIAKKASIPTDILTHKNATKAAILAKLPGESIVHLATHGYFASTQNLPKAWRESLGAVALVRSAPTTPMVSYATRNLLLSSGLLLAPASPTPVPVTNLALASSRTVSARLPAPPQAAVAAKTTTGSVRQADRLSSEELIGLNLSKCKLITLSACETGRGEEVTGQGVMGLRSAMMAAGARSILMSLWKVPDDATQKLMSYFYTNLLIKKLPRAEALKLAQESVRDDPSGKYKHPWYWAAWVLAGEGW